MRKKLIEIISDALVQNQFKILLCKSISPVEEATIIADILIERGVTILPEGAITLTRAEIEALNEYQKKLNEGVITNTENKSNNSADMSNKQIEDRAEGEWKDNHCTVCGVMPLGEEIWTNLGLSPPRYDYFMSYCPICGAKMKGADDEQR